MWCKNKFFIPAFLLCFCAVQAQAGLFGISFKHRQEFVDARETYNRGDYRQAVIELSNYIYKTKNIKRREARAYRLLGLSYEHLNQPEKPWKCIWKLWNFTMRTCPCCWRRPPYTSTLI